MPKQEQIDVRYCSDIFLQNHRKTLSSAIPDNIRHAFQFKDHGTYDCCCVLSLNVLSSQSMKEDLSPSSAGEARLYYLIYYFQGINHVRR